MTKASHDDQVLNEYAQTLIRVKAKQLVRRPGFSRSDQEDVEQDLCLHVLSKFQKFDPTRSSLNTFVDRIVNSAAAMLVRERNRNKRSPVGNVEVHSLEMKIERSTDSSKPFWASTSIADLQRRTGRASLSDAELYELVEGVTSAIAGLPPELRQVCESLLKQNRSETVSELGLSRRGFDAAMARIRDHFARAGFGKI